MIEQLQIIASTIHKNDKKLDDEGNYPENKTDFLSVLDTFIDELEKNDEKMIISLENVLFILEFFS